MIIVLRRYFLQSLFQGKKATIKKTFWHFKSHNKDIVTLSIVEKRKIGFFQLTTLSKITVNLHFTKKDKDVSSRDSIADEGGINRKWF